MTLTMCKAYCTLLDHVVGGGGQHTHIMRGNTLYLSNTLFHLEVFNPATQGTHSLRSEREVIRFIAQYGEEVQA